MKMRRLVPMLPVSSMPASVDFYRKLGFSVEQRNDAWRWAMLCLGECRLMLESRSMFIPPLRAHACFTCIRMTWPGTTNRCAATAWRCQIWKQPFTE